MSAIEIFLTILYNILPAVILTIPYFFIRKRLIGKFYFRFLLGIIVFYLIYWVLPVIFQLTATPIELTGGDLGLGIGYIAAHFGSLVALFATYPLITLPFIFFVAPLISIIHVWRRLRKEEGSTRDNLGLLTYQLNESPRELIKQGIMKGDWTREKEILKLLLVLLPISLYLLQVILTVSDLETVSLTTGKTALGWFLEILFVYLATFIFSIELLYSSKIALKGRNFGETIRNQTYKSLYSVGAPISILSIVLFVAQYLESMPIVIYFFAYFFMASVIFILFLKFFEPISLLIFVKIIHWWKCRKEKMKSISSRNVIYIITYSILAVIVYLLLNIFVFSPIFVTFFPNDGIIVQSARFDQPQSLLYAFGFDLMNVFIFIVLVVTPTLMAVLSVVYALKKMRSKFLGYLTSLIIMIGFSVFFMFLGANAIINFAPDTYWITGQTSFTSVFGFDFYTLRTAGLNADLSGLLGFLSIPYIYTRYIFNIIVWSLIFTYMGKKFKTENMSIDENSFEKTIFSSIDEFMHFDDYIKGDILYLVTKGEDLTSVEIEKERDEIKTFLNLLDKNKLLSELVPVDDKEKQRFYFTLKYLYNNGLIDIYEPEFSFTYEKIEKQALYIIYDDGRGIFDYSFVEAYDQDPGLISGMFSAITSFIKETTRSQDLLKTIDHGDIRILIEYRKRIFGALFMKGKHSSDVRTFLEKFVDKFESKYSDVLKDWSGALSPFKGDKELVEDIFKEE
ncbi:MAG: hypothetical protein ACTSR7_20090 [Promethearchaeota archaeon]